MRGWIKGWVTTLLTSHLSLFAGVAAAQAPFPPLPDSTGWGVHVLTVVRDSRGDVWVGTRGWGIFRLRGGASHWERIRHDPAVASSIASDYVNAIAFGPRGEVWYGTIGNGWGVSLDGGTSWKNWSAEDLGSKWRYIAPGGIVTRGDTTFVGTADGIQVTSDNGGHYAALVDSLNVTDRGPADTAIAILLSPYVKRLGLDRLGILVTTLRGNQRLIRGPEGWTSQTLPVATFTPLNSLLIAGVSFRGTPCGLRPATDTIPCPRNATKEGGEPAVPRTVWFRRPIDRRDNSQIDQTRRYGTTLDGDATQNQGVDFNNPTGTPVYAIGSGDVVFTGPGVGDALTVVIRHDSTVTGPGGRLRLYSVYAHNSTVLARVGQRVQPGTLIARVGNTGQSTHPHLGLQVHASPTDSIRGVIIDSTERHLRYATNPELWIEPLQGTGIVAGRVVAVSGEFVQRARIYGLLKNEPTETPFSYIETYDDQANPNPIYGENFAITDVPPGSYVLGTEINGKRVSRKITVAPDSLTWVILKP